MRRPPRSAEVDRLVTKKLVVFSYLQIGVIQAVAGFYTWFVVMGDYGFSPSILPGLGAHDAWGKQTLFCRPTGYTTSGQGHTKTAGDFNVKFRNLAGMMLSEMSPTNKKGRNSLPWDDMTSDHIRNFPFWDGGVESCTYATRNWAGKGVAKPTGWAPGLLASASTNQHKEYSAEEFPQSRLGEDTADTNGAPAMEAKLRQLAAAPLVGVLHGSLYTAEETVATSITYAALEAGGYRPYIPWKGRKSPFFKNEWLAAGVHDIELGIPGFGVDVDPQVAFSVEPVGLFNVLYWDNDAKKDCRKSGTGEDEQPFAIIKSTDAMYDEAERKCTIDTLPVSRVLGDFEVPAWRDGKAIAGSDVNAALSRDLHPTGWQETHDIQLSASDCDGLKGDIPSLECKVEEMSNCCGKTGGLISREKLGGAEIMKDGFGQHTPAGYSLGQPTCSASVWSAYCEAQGTVQTNAKCNFGSVHGQQDGKHAGVANQLINTQECAFWNFNTATKQIEVDPIDKIDNKISCAETICQVKKTALQHVYNIVEVRQYVKLPKTSKCETKADLPNTEDQGKCEVKGGCDCNVAVSYPNWKTASVFDLRGRKCKGGICMNVASRMIQKEALHHAQCAYFVSIVVVQWADLVICKTRMNSIYHQGMLNPAMNFGLIFETMLAAILCYTPGVTTALGTRPVKLVHWFPGCLYSIFIFWYDELRKAIMRSTTDCVEDEQTGQVSRDPGWMERNTYY